MVPSHLARLLDLSSYLARIVLRRLHRMSNLRKGLLMHVKYLNACNDLKIKDQLKHIAVITHYLSI